MNEAIHNTTQPLVQPPADIFEETIALAALAALKEGHKGVCDLRDAIGISDPALAFFYSQAAYILARCLVGNAPARRDFLSLAIAGQRAFNRGGRG